LLSQQQRKNLLLNEITLPVESDSVIYLDKVE